MNLCVQIYEITKSFPSEEKYGLVSQMRRAAVSVPSNVAEGYGQVSVGAYARHLRIAKGSNNELETMLILSRELGYLEESSKLESSTAHVGSLLTGLIRSVEGNVVREIDALYGEEETRKADDFPF